MESTLLDCHRAPEFQNSDATDISQARTTCQALTGQVTFTCCGIQSSPQPYKPDKDTEAQRNQTERKNGTNGKE